MMFGNFLLLPFLYLSFLPDLSEGAYSSSRPPAPRTAMSRRDIGRLVVSGATFGVVATATSDLKQLRPQPAIAFDGSGTSAYSGRGPATKEELRKSYQDRIVADVRDFNKLGAAISKGETDGGAWINFFIEMQRREPDSVGRTYAALADLRGLPVNKKRDEFQGGDGFLLANTFTKQGKPPDNTPAVQKFKALVPAFDPIELAGKNGDAKKAKVAFDKASALLSDYLASVGLPASLDDPIYQ